MLIMIEFSTEASQFQSLFILSLVFLSHVKYRFNQLQSLNPLVEKLDACTSLSRKMRLSGDTCKPQHSTLVHQQYIGKTTNVVFMLFKLKQLLVDLNTLILLSVFYQNNLTMVFLFQHMRTIVSCWHICAPNHVEVQLSVGVLNV